MTLTNKELLEFAKTQNPKAELDIECSVDWLAAQAATQLSGKKHIMNGWSKFNDFWHSPYTEVTPEYAKWCERVVEYNADNNTHITFQDAVEALEGFV